MAVIDGGEGWGEILQEWEFTLRSSDQEFLSDAGVCAGLFIEYHLWLW